MKKISEYKVIRMMGGEDPRNPGWHCSSCHQCGELDGMCVEEIVIDDDTYAEVCCRVAEDWNEYTKSSE